MYSVKKMPATYRYALEHLLGKRWRKDFSSMKQAKVIKTVW